MSDSVADLLTRIRNAQLSKLLFVLVKKSSFNKSILDVLKNEGYIGAQEWNINQAYRVSLANVRDWLDAQLALLSTQMVKFEQIFLPYMTTDNGQSVYERFAGSKFTLLNSGLNNAE